MLKESTALVEAGIKARKTLDQLKSEKVLGKFESLSWEFIKTDRFTEIIYADLTAKK